MSYIDYRQATEAQVLATGNTIRFTKELREKQFASIEEIVKLALTRKKSGGLYSYLINLQHKTVLIRPDGRTYYQSLGFSRSLEDLFLLSKHYLPKTTYEDVKAALHRVGTRTHYCGTHNKVMYQLQNQ